MVSGCGPVFSATRRRIINIDFANAALWQVSSLQQVWQKADQKATRGRAAALCNGLKSIGGALSSSIHGAVRRSTGRRFISTCGCFHGGKHLVSLSSSMKRAGSVAPIEELCVLLPPAGLLWNIAHAWNKYICKIPAYRTFTAASLVIFVWIFHPCLLPHSAGCVKGRVRFVFSQTEASTACRQVLGHACGTLGMFFLLGERERGKGRGGWTEEPERMGREAKMSRGWGSVERPPTPNRPPEVPICRLNWSNRHWLMRVHKCSWKTLFNRVVLMVERGDARGLTDKHPQRLCPIGRSLPFKVLVSLKPHWALS